MMHLSIFLLKEDRTTATAIRDDVQTHELAVAAAGVTLGVLHLKASGRPEPSWFKLFAGALGALPFGLQSRSISALYLTSAGGRVFALAFGHGRHLLAPGSWEERFGLKTTLNLVDPDKLRSIDRRVFDTVLRQGREQSAEPTQATNFGLNVETDLVRAVSGEPIDKTCGERVSGADVLVADVAVTLASLSDLLARYLTAFGDTKYRERFEWIDQMGEVTDATLRDRLDAELVARLRADNYDRLWLAVPEVVDWSRVAGFAFTRRKGATVQRDLHFRYLFEVGRDPAAVDLESLKRWSAVAFDGGGEATDLDWAVYRCICFEIAEGDQVFLLADGKWYRIAKTYVQAVEQAFRSLVSVAGELPPFDADNEGKYNEGLAGADYQLVDRKLARIGGDPVEPCDLYGKDGRIIHVKRYSNSKPMSHLFGQALVSGDAMKSDEAFRTEFANIVGAGFPFDVAGFRAQAHPCARHRELGGRRRLRPPLLQQGHAPARGQPVAELRVPGPSRADPRRTLDPRTSRRQGGERGEAERAAGQAIPMNPLQLELAAFLRRQVLPMFGGRDTPKLHPWWWPRGWGTTDADWFGTLRGDDVHAATGLVRGAVLRSLRLGAGKKVASMSPESAEGFQGYWGCGPTDGRRLVVLTEQPSDGAYPLGIHASFLRRLRQLGLIDSHVTNFNKRRLGATFTGEDEAFQLAILTEELGIVGRGAERLVVCPSLSWARSADAVLAQLSVGLSAALPGTEVLVVRAAHERSPCEPPRALYGQWVKDTDEPEVLDSWRRVIDVCL